MSVEASDVQSDEDCEELVDESFRFSDDFLGKKTSRKRSAKPPPSPKSPYMSSLSVNPRRAAVAAWRLPRASLGGYREGTPGDQGLSLIRADYSVSPELIKKTLASKQRILQSTANGFSYTAADFRDREDMYDEILRLKKSVQAHKSDNQQLKARLRRAEEDKAKRERQIQELLDPTKGADYARSLVDKKREGSVVVNGLKQRILKLEQQCREKENALSKLQSDLRTTSLEEQRITAQTYYQEIQRLKLLLDAAEKSILAESKCSQRQQRALSYKVRDLSETVTHLQQENCTLKEELSRERPAGGAKGYREWSKHRLLRRLLELEKILEEQRSPAHWEKSCVRLDPEVQTRANDGTDGMEPLTVATEAVVSVETMTEGGAELSQSEESALLQEALRRAEEKLMEVKTEKEEMEREMEEWRRERTSERERERLQHELEMEVLWTKIQTLEEEKERAALTDHLTLSDLTAERSNTAVTAERSNTAVTAERSNPGGTAERSNPGGTAERSNPGGTAERSNPGGTAERSNPGGTAERPQDRGEDTGHLQGPGERRRERAARLIQRRWRQYRDKDVLLLQSVFRGHQLRHTLLKAATETEGQMDTQDVIMLQSVFRGHLSRSSTAPHSSMSECPVRLRVDRRLQPLHHLTGEAPPAGITNPEEVSAPVQTQTAVTDGGAADSDDSDDIIVSPSRPIRRREVLIT